MEKIKQEKSIPLQNPVEANETWVNWNTWVTGFKTAFSGNLIIWKGYFSLRFNSSPDPFPAKLDGSWKITNSI